MYKKELAHRERYFRDSGDELQVETSLTVFEVYVETSKDREGKLFLNRDGSERLFAIRDADFVRLEEDKVVRKIRDDFYRVVYQVEEDYVERFEKDGRRVYYVVNPEEIVTLPAGTQIIPTNHGGIKVPQEIGYALVDDTEPDAQRVLAVRKFSTEDHVAEAEEVLNSSSYVHRTRE